MKTLYCHAYGMEIKTIEYDRLKSCPEALPYREYGSHYRWESSLVNESNLTAEAMYLPVPKLLVSANSTF